MTDFEMISDKNNRQNIEKCFEFGKNWRRFLSCINKTRIVEAERSIKMMLEVKNLDGLSFLDIGSGSGLFSLAARRLGARVLSFDYDPDSVKCTMELKRRYLQNDTGWTIEHGSVLDEMYIRSLGSFDIVYAWGVLHHTGNMKMALTNVTLPVEKGGKLWLAIYNDQGFRSRFWRSIKQYYCSGRAYKIAVLLAFFPYFFMRGFFVDLIRLRNPIQRYSLYCKSRGMSPFRDWIDWLGGYPFEVAKPEEIFDFYRKRIFQLLRLKTCGGGLGNNEYVFVKSQT